MRRLFPSWRCTARKPLRKMGALVPLILTPLPIDAKPSVEGARDARDRLSIPLQEATGQQAPPFSPRSFFITLTQPPVFAEGQGSAPGRQVSQGRRGSWDAYNKP